MEGGLGGSLSFIMKRTYISPSIKTILISSTVLCDGSRLDLTISSSAEGDGVADANGRRSHWGNLWDEE